MKTCVYTPLTASDRADIVASVFKLHLDELKRDLKVIFGTKLADIRLMEYQIVGGERSEPLTSDIII